MSRRTLAVTSALALLTVPAAAAAVSGDGNDDALPDRWERRHGLSLKVDQSGRDQDRDGLRNRGEFRHGTHPRRADSDRDGLRDGLEVRLGHDPRRHDDDHLDAGAVSSYADGVLTVALARGGTVRARVTGVTEVKCEAAHARAARRGDDDGGDDRGRGRGSDDGAGDDRGRGRGSDDGAGDDRGRGRGRDDGADDDRGRRGRDEVECGPSALARGRMVREAELLPGSGRTIWREVKLLG